MAAYLICDKTGEAGLARYRYAHPATARFQCNAPAPGEPDL